jgi:hypothetical protein
LSMFTRHDETTVSIFSNRTRRGLCNDHIAFSCDLLIRWTRGTVNLAEDVQQHAKSDKSDARECIPYILGGSTHDFVYIAFSVAQLLSHVTVNPEQLTGRGTPFQRRARKSNQERGHHASREQGRIQSLIVKSWTVGPVEAIHIRGYFIAFSVSAPLRIRSNSQDFGGFCVRERFTWDWWIVPAPDDIRL